MKSTLLFLLFTLFMGVNAQVTANAGSDRLICINDTLKATGSGLSSGDTGSYQWKDLNSNIVLSLNNSFSIKITSLTTKKYELTVNRTHNKVNYTSKDTFILTVSPLPTFKFKGLPPRCYSDGCLNLTLNIIASATQGNDTSKKFYALRYFQRYKSPSWISGGPVGSAPYIYCLNNLSNSQILQTGLKDTICYEYKDSNGCYNYECKPIKTNPNPDVQVKNGIYCQRNGLVNLDPLVTIPFNRTGGVENWRCIKVPAGSGVDSSKIVTVDNSVVPPKFWLDIGLEGENKKTGDYYMEYCFKNPTTGCQRWDTSSVTVIRLPEIVFDNIPGQCINGTLLTLDSFVREKTTGKRFPTGTWQCVAYGGSRDMNNPTVKNAIHNSVKFQKYFDPQISLNGGQYLFKFTDISTGCPISDSVEVLVYGLPQIILPQPDSVCSNSGKYLLYSNYTLNDTNGKWSGEYVSMNKLNSDLVTMGNQYSKSTKVKYTYKSPLTKCSNNDSQYVVLIKRPYFRFVQYVWKNSQYAVSFYLTDSNMSMTNFRWEWDYGNGKKANNRHLKPVPYLDSGNYKVYLTINNGLCDTKDSISFDLNYKASSINDIVRIPVAIYPNPVQAELFVNSFVDGVFAITDINGKRLLSGNVRSMDMETLDVSALKPGLYLLMIQNNEYNYRVKFIKE